MKARHSPLLLRVSTLVVVLALAVGCSKPPNDAKVTSDIQSKFATDSGLQNKQLTVQVANGAVTLSGLVDNDAERDAAAKYAASEPGVKQVINNLEIAPSAASTEPAPEPASSQSSTPEEQKPSPASRKHHHHASQASNEMADASTSAANATPPQPAAPPQTAAVSALALPAPPPQKVTIPSGTSLAVRLIDSINSATAQTGDTFHATLDVPVAIDGEVVIPKDYDVEGHVVNAQASGKFSGRALLDLQLDRIKVGDRWYNIETDHFKQETGSRGKNSAEKVGAGAVAGAILGGIFGGGKGAAIGSVAGAGAGGGVQAASKKPDIKLPSERVLTFTLQAPVTLVPTTKPAREGQSLQTSTQQ